MMKTIKRLLLRLALGQRTYQYMCKSLSQDPRLPTAKLADIIVRKDGREVRIEADWLKTLCKLVADDLTPPVPQTSSEEVNMARIAEREAKLQRVIAEKRALIQKN